MNMFVGREDSPFVQELLRVKAGTILAAPPVHDCAYIRVRNMLSAEASTFAHQETRGIKDTVAREAEQWKVYTVELQRLLAEHSGRNP
jgi:hypothetical protein